MDYEFDQADLTTYPQEVQEAYERDLALEQDEGARGQVFRMLGIDPANVGGRFPKAIGKALQRILVEAPSARATRALLRTIRANLLSTLALTLPQDASYTRLVTRSFARYPSQARTFGDATSGRPFPFVNRNDTRLGCLSPDSLSALTAASSRNSYTTACSGR